MGNISVVNLRATATFPSLWFIVTAAPAFSNWTPHGKRFASKPLRARRPSGCWRTRATPSTTLRQSSAMSVLQETRWRSESDAERLQIEEALTAVQEELAAERALRARAESERDEAAVATQTAEQRLRQRTAVKAACTTHPCLTTSLDAGAVGLRRSCGKLPQTIRRSSNGGRQGGRRNTGRELPGAWWVKDRSTNHRDEQGDHNYQSVSIVITPNAPIRRDDRRRVFPVARHCCSAI